MRTLVGVTSLAVLCTAGLVNAQQQQGSAPPSWAYGFATPPDPSAQPAAGGQRGAGGRGGGGGAPAPDTTKRTLAGSTASFTLAQIRDGFGPADWFPNDHPQMPPIVAQGRREAMITACSLCHYPNGKGRPENAGVAALPVEYFIKTMTDFKNDARKSADSRKTNTNRMIQFAKAMTDDEIRAAAAYFGSMKWTPWVKVVETNEVPKTRIAGGMFITLEGAEAGKEPIGQRIIEVPESAEQTETLRNPRSSFIAYVPRGSIKKGEAVATRGQCAVCHGENLTGLGPVPSIAGRSPSYMVRQLYDMQRGVRSGSWSELMKRVVGPMSAEDMLNVAAYVASKTP
jgi:cytochrome c553